MGGIKVLNIYIYIFFSYVYMYVYIYKYTYIIYIYESMNSTFLHASQPVVCHSSANVPYIRCCNLFSKDGLGGISVSWFQIADCLEGNICDEYDIILLATCDQS